MITVKSTEIQNRFGHYVDEARKTPVHIQRYDKTIAVIVSAEEYQRLTAADKELKTLKKK